MQNYFHTNAAHPKQPQAASKIASPAVATGGGGDGWGSLPDAAQSNAEHPMWMGFSLRGFPYQSVVKNTSLLDSSGILHGYIPR